MEQSVAATPETTAAYRAALDRLPVLTRVIFLTHRTATVSHREIARRLSIGNVTVAANVAKARLMIRAMTGGGNPLLRYAALFTPGEKALRQRHRAYCETHLRASGVMNRVKWKKAKDDPVTVAKTILSSLPEEGLETVLLNRVDGLRFAQVAERIKTSELVVKRRILDAVARISDGPEDFEDWLQNLVRQPASRTIRA